MKPIPSIVDEETVLHRRTGIQVLLIPYSSLTLLFLQFLSLASSSGASEGPQASPQPRVPEVCVTGAPGSPAPCQPQWIQQKSPPSLPKWAGTAHSASLESCLQGQATPLPCEGTCASMHTYNMPTWIHLNRALFNTHTHTGTHPCASSWPHDLSCPHIHAQVQAPSHTDTCRHPFAWTCARALSNIPTCQLMGRHLCIGTLSGTHTDMNAHRAMCMHLCMHFL